MKFMFLACPFKLTFGSIFGRSSIEDIPKSRIQVEVLNILVNVMQSPYTESNFDSNKFNFSNPLSPASCWQRQRGL